MNLESFANDKFLVLKFLADNQQLQNGEMFVKLNKQFIADELHFRKDKVIRIIDELTEEGFIFKVSVKGKFRILEKGHKVLDIFLNTEI